MNLESYWVYSEGLVLRAADASVSAFDHGFLYGDSVYETLRTHSGCLFAVEDHLQRLHASAEAIGLGLPWGDAGLRAALAATIGARPRGAEAGVRLVVSRGTGPITLDVDACPAPSLLVYGWAIPAGRHPAAEQGVHVAITSVRRNPVGALDPRIKSGNFLNNILAFRDAKAAGAMEGVLLHLDGTVAECTTSNIFWVKSGKVYTPDEVGILHGVTRKRILDFLPKEGIPASAGSYPARDLERADEVFITSTLKGVLPVVRLGDLAVGGGAPGPITRRIMQRLELEIAAECGG